MNRLSRTKEVLLLSTTLLAIMVISGCSASTAPGPTDATHTKSTVTAPVTKTVTAPDGSTHQEVEYPEEDPSAEQVAAMADETVTYDEYKAAWTRYASCAAKAGFTIIIRGETDQIVDAAIPDEAVKDGADSRCYTRELRQVDMWWQLYRQAVKQAPQVAACLQARGITPEELPAGATINQQFNAWTAQLEKSGSELDECVGEG